jgi:hypothetical protein
VGGLASEDEEVYSLGFLREVRSPGGRTEDG